MKYNVCKWGGVGIIDERWVCWTEGEVGTDDDPILNVALLRNGKYRHWRESKSGSCSTILHEQVKDFALLWRIGRSISPIPENSTVVGHYRTYGDDLQTTR